ncbi:MAG: DUF6383 domain-containing protein [Tannerellaceae bacterium]|nr:DUF6383 domain-containing protein [Tannerellaceae bacterium]
MNKKFSTFLVALLALVSGGSVLAQTSAARQMADSVHVETGLYSQDVYVPDSAQTVQTLELGKNTGFFQLAIDGEKERVLALSETGKLIIEDLTSEDPAVPFVNTLWCVEVTKQDQSQTPKFDYVNKGTGLPLDINYNPTYVDLAVGALSTDSVAVGGEIAGWSLSPQYANDIEAGVMYSSYDTDMVIGFYVDEDTAFVHVRKTTFNEAVAGSDTLFTKFRLQEAAEKVLDANEINTILNSQANDLGVKLSFDPDILNAGNLENPFNAQAFLAEAVSEGDASEGVYITKKGATSDNYLRVDTAYVNDEGVKFLAYKWADVDSEGLMEDNYKFIFTYNYTYDSLYVQVKNAYVKTDDSVGWTDNNLTPISYLYVSIQSIITGQSRIITVGNVQGTHISFGIPNCAPSDGLTSVPEDLYLIKNEAGQYLAVPISGDSVAYWVTLDEYVEPWNMPSFQWVVEKTRKATPEVSATSSLNITNREFRDVYFNSVQLYNDAYTTSISALEKKEGSLVVGSINAEGFEAATPEIKANPYLGYRKLDEDSLMITGYTLRYLHDYNDQNYIGLAHGDSVLYAAGQTVRFALDTIVTVDSISTTVDYGYTTGAISGLAQLKRQSYQFRVKGEVNDTYVVANDADRYAVSASDDATVVARRSVFFLKENNYKDGISYYALIDTAAFRYSSPDSLRKVGVADASVLLKAEDMTELRTSAFALEYDETPLYRRFKTDPAENATASTNDGPEVMRFKEIYRNEYLQIEQNPNFTVAGIDFLGIDALNKYPGGKSFTVDSAWVGRGLGYIKPQYLISIDRNDQAPVDAIPCPEEFHGYAPDGTPYDQWTCPHATAGSDGFNRGKYLINFELNGYGDGDANEYMWGKYYRAGFVDGVQVGDSLYILRDEFAGLTNAQINLANIISADSAWRVENNSSDLYYIVNLRGDQHKFVTWSMRYVDPENYEQDNTFLIESMNQSHNVSSEQWIAPQYSAWLKMQNGCLVLSTYDSSFDIETGGDDALIFNVDVEGDELTTDDEVIAESSVVVIAGQGTVTVKNAAGKKVSISNILGQTVANTVVTSDNATIAVPAGVVVVAVEGEAAVKAIVK